MKKIFLVLTLALISFGVSAQSIKPPKRPPNEKLSAGVNPLDSIPRRPDGTLATEEPKNKNMSKDSIRMYQKRKELMKKKVN